MNSYGDPQSARARARVPGPSAASTPDDDQSGSAPGAYRRTAGGRASVGSAAPRGAASVGAASVGGRASVGAASVGSARVGGRAPDAAPTYGARASVARAAVRPVSPAVGGPGGDPDGAGHGKRGSAAKILNKAAKRRRRTNILTAAAAVVVILLGGGVVGGTYFFDSVDFTEPTAEAQTTQLMASDNKTVLASLGQFNRSIVPDRSINPLIKLAVISAEDNGFYDHNGIDMKGIARAAYNNFTGGDTQGASTITQQYARYAAKLKEISYNRKLREAVIARKMEDEYTKDEILGRYLNSTYFGRGAYGIEAAVKAYFGTSRSALTPLGTKGAITAGEAAILAAVIKQPEASPTHPGYDPDGKNPEAQSRWNYVVGRMAALGLPAGMPAAGVPAGINPPTEYPKTWKPYDPEKCTTTCGNNKPSAKIVKYVKRELREMGISDAKLNEGGLKIQTTIDPKVQALAEKAANRASDDSPLNGMPATYKSALVAINPANGRVIAYYGGPDAASWDYAGPNYSSDGKEFLGGGRPPGSTFKIYTLLAALSDGYGMDTIWDSTKNKVNGGGPINNSGREGGSLRCRSPKACDLKTSVAQSYNFPFYWIADALGPEKVIETAHKAGIQLIGDPETTARWDLNKLSTEELKEKSYGREVGFGQYAITALDHASGVATIANDGVYNKAHFVRAVAERDATGKFKNIKGKGEKLKPVTAFNPNVIAAAQDVMQEIPGINSIALDNGRKAIGKTGTWEFTGKGGKSGDNGDAWMVGATKQLAVSVWIGAEKENKKTKQMDLKPIYKPGGKPMNGGSTPGQIWKMFLDSAMKAMDAPEEGFLPNSSAFVDPNKKGNGVAPVEIDTPDTSNNEFCEQFPGLPICQNGNNNGGNNGNNGGNNGNNGGNNGNNGGGNDDDDGNADIDLPGN